MGDELEVRSLEHRVQVGDRGRAAQPVAAGHLVAADALLSGCVEVGVVGQPGGSGGVEPRLAQQAARAAILDRERTTDAVVLALAALVVLGALEVREQIVVAPPLAAVLVAPLVVVGPVAADVDHRVDRG